MNFITNKFSKIRKSPTINLGNSRTIKQSDSVKLKIEQNAICWCSRIWVVEKQTAD